MLPQVPEAPGLRQRALWQLFCVAGNLRFQLICHIFIKQTVFRIEFVLNFFRIDQIGNGIKNQRESEGPPENRQSIYTEWMTSTTLPCVHLPFFINTIPYHFIIVCTKMQSSAIGA